MLPPDLATLRQRLSREVAGKTRLYLDTGFWAAFCDHELGIGADPITGEALAGLRTRVSEGTVVCPVGEHLLAELFRQRLPTKRAVTAKLMDELGGGVAFLPGEDRVAIEFLNFTRINRTLEPVAVREPLRTLWTRPVFAFGHFSPAKDDFPAELLPLLTRLTHNELWKVTIQEIATREDVSVEWAAPFNGVHESLNAQKRASRERFKNYKQQYLNEIHGACEAYSAALQGAILHRFKAAGGNVKTVPSAEIENSTKAMARLIRAAFAKRESLVLHLLPTIHVLATLYARMDWDAGRNYHPGDVADFGHAAAAIPYCNGFATDRALAKLLLDSGITGQFPCRVVDSMDQLQSLLRDLGKSPDTSGA